MEQILPSVIKVEKQIKHFDLSPTSNRIIDKSNKKLIDDSTYNNDNSNKLNELPNINNSNKDDYDPIDFQAWDLLKDRNSREKRNFWMYLFYIYNLKNKNTINDLYISHIEYWTNVFIKNEEELQKLMSEQRYVKDGSVENKKIKELHENRRKFREKIFPTIK